MEQLILFTGIVALTTISPGADFAMVSRTSALEGRRAGLAVALGVAVSCWIHVIYAVFGLELATRHVPGLLDIIRYAGVAYLTYLGLKMIFSRGAKPATLDDRSPRSGHGHFFLLGLMTNALNPKTSIFVVSLYAQVVGPQTSILVQLAYGVIISGLHLMWFSLVAYFLSRETVRRHVNQHRQLIDRIIGSLLILLAVALLTYPLVR